MKKYKLVLVKNIEQIINKDTDVVFMTTDKKIYQLYKEMVQIYYVDAINIENIVNLISFLYSKNIIINGYYNKDMDTELDNGDILELKKELEQKNRILEEKNRIINSYKNRKIIKLLNKLTGWKK